MNTRPRRKSKHDPPRLAHIDGTALIITFKGDDARRERRIPMLTGNGVQKVQCIDTSCEQGSVNNYASAKKLGLPLPRTTGVVTDPNSISRRPIRVDLMNH